MARVVSSIREQTIQDDNATVEPAQTATSARQMTIAERLIYYVGGVIMSIIALRIILSLMGANRGNGFASFVYSVSYPFVAPFFGLFNYKMQYGVSRFEFESLVALVVWGMITAAIARLVTITRNA
jgi:YggT family protein